MTTTFDQNNEDVRLLIKFRAAFSEWNKYHKNNTPHVGELLLSAIATLEKELTH